MNQPNLIPQAFAENGSKNEINKNRQPGQPAQDATWSDGFPSVTMMPIEAGGLPPNGQDFNGVLNTLSQGIIFQQKGGIYLFDQSYADNIGGYAKGAVLMAKDHSKLFISTIDKNLNDPNSNIEGWNIFVGEGAIPSASGEVSGITKVINSTTNSSTTSAASAASVKKLQDEKLDKSIANIMHTRAAPSGEVAYFALENAPEGWLKANGAAVSRKEYANLFAVIGTKYGRGDGATTFHVPDLRGEFIRGLDDGRNVDLNRKLGSYQGDAIRNITGTLGNGSLDGDMGIFNRYRSTGAFYSQENENRGYLAAKANNKVDDRTFLAHLDASRVVPTANENRPRNIALLACIKA